LTFSEIIIFNIFLSSMKKRTAHNSTIITPDVLKTVVDEAFEGFIILDEKGYVQYTNERNFEYLGTPPPETIVGKHITELPMNADVAQGFMEILQTGKKELLTVIQDRGREFVCHRFPLMKNGTVIGAVGIILFDVKDVSIINKKIGLLEHKLNYYKKQLHRISYSKYSLEDIIGESENFKQVKEEALKAAKTNANLLLTGETGTGKELFAHAIHNLSKRKFGPFVKLNCSAIPSELLESELFGYEPGSFTGAQRTGRKGKFELADSGTIFLDEIGDMPLQMQGGLLRVLQEKEVDRIGGGSSVKVDFRVIAATNKNLEELVEKGLFRLDLLYRLNVINIDLPPLRERIEDISVLVEFFSKQKTEELGLHNLTISPQALNALRRYDFPGNVRELENILEKAINRKNIDDLSKGFLTISEEDITTILKLNLVSKPKKHFSNLNKVREAKYNQEVKMIREAIVATGGNLTESARLLGMHRTGLHQKIRLYDLESEVSAARKGV